MRAWVGRGRKGERAAAAALRVLRSAGVAGVILGVGAIGPIGLVGLVGLVGPVSAWAAMSACAVMGSSPAIGLGWQEARLQEEVHRDVGVHRRLRGGLAGCLLARWERGVPGGEAVTRELSVITGLAPRGGARGPWFLEGRQGLIEDFFRFEVREFPEGVELRLVAAGDRGLSFLREFFESSLFLPEETEGFYRLLGAGRGARGKRVGRLDCEWTQGREGALVQVVFRWRGRGDRVSG